MQRNDYARELQDVLHHEIPLSQQIGLSVASYKDGALSLRAPLAPNINHKATAFAGSLNAVMTLAGWGLTWLMLREREMRAVIVIQQSEIRYAAPVNGDFTATCHAPGAQHIERFVEGLRRRGKARIALAVEIHDAAGDMAVSFTGSYVAFLNVAVNSQS